MKEPNYEAYSLDELLDAQRNIDGERFPERRSRLEAEIAKRRSAPHAVEAPPSGVAHAPEPISKRSRVPAVVALITVAVLVLAGVGLWGASFVSSPEFLKMKASTHSVAAAVGRAFPDQTFVTSVQGKVEQARRELEITIVNSSWLELAEEARKQRAQQVAAVALRGYPRPQDVARIEVRYEERSEMGPVKTYRRSKYMFRVQAPRAGGVPDKQQPQLVIP